MYPRAFLWTGGVALSGAAFGAAWLTQPVEMPVWALLVLTFVPTRELTEALRAPLTRIQGGANG